MNQSTLIHRLFLFTLSIGVTIVAATADAKRPDKLPQKTTPTRRTFLDFTKDDATVISKPLSPLNLALDKSRIDVQTAGTPTQVRSRKIKPAPEGDLAEPIAAFATKPAPTPLATLAPTRVMKAAATPVPTPPAKVATNPSIAPRATATPIPVAIPVVEPLPVVVAAPVVEPPSTDLAAAEPAPTPVPVIEPEPVAKVTAQTKSVEPSTDDGFIKSIQEETMAFIRTGYYTANYKKFDERMNNGASVIGIGVARGAETSWGSFEARAAFDVYHAMDQSVTVDNIRMFSVRTELAYWLSRSRVKPGVSLGLGWADYSIRSYRSVTGANEEEVTLRTHAKARAFSVIPATSLRIELSKGLVVDVQTEFMALLGGNSPDAAQGLGVNVALGWIF